MKTRNIREVKVGDIVQNEIGDRYKVIELLKDTFACLDCDDELRPRWIYWIAFDEANEAVWFIENKEVTEVFDGVEDIDLEKHHQNILDGLAEEDEKAKVKVGVDDSEEVFTKKEIEIGDTVVTPDGKRHKVTSIGGDSDEVEFTKEELNFLKNVIIRTPARDDETGHYLGRIYHKLNKMLKEKANETN